MRNTNRRILGVTPFQAHFGRKINTPVRNITTNPSVKNLTYKPVLNALDRETLQGRNLVDANLQEEIPSDVEARSRFENTLKELGTTKQMMSCSAQHFLENMPEEVPRDYDQLTRRARPESRRKKDLDALFRQLPLGTQVLKQSASTITIKMPGKREQVVRNSDIAKIGDGGFWQLAARKTVGGTSTLPMGRVRQNPNVSADEGDLDASQYDIPNIPTGLLFEHASDERLKLEGNKAMRKRPQQGVSARKADTVRAKRRRTRSATSGSDQQGASGSAGQAGDSHPDSTSQDEDGQAQSTAEEDLQGQSTSAQQRSSQSNKDDVPSVTTSTASTTSLTPKTSTPKKRVDAANAAKAQMLEHDRQQAGLKTVTWADAASDRRTSSRQRRAVDKLGGFPVLHVSQEGDQITQVISAPPSRPSSPDLHPELETNTLLQSSNARDTSSTGVANMSQQPPSTRSDDLSVIAGPSSLSQQSATHPESRVTAPTSNVPESRVTAHTPQFPPSVAPESQLQQPAGIVTDNPPNVETTTKIQSSGIVSANPENNVLATQIQQHFTSSAPGTESTTEGEASSTSAIIGTTRNRAARISESESSSEYDDENDERGDHSASTEMARDESLRFTPSSQGENNSDHVLDPEDL